MQAAAGNSEAPISTPVPVATSTVMAGSRWIRERARGLWRAGVTGADWMFGLVSLITGLAVVSVIPVLNVLSLGYLVHASGRVAASGRLRDGLVGLPQAAVLGRLLLGSWLVIFPLRLVLGMWRDAELLAPGSAVARRWQVGLSIVAFATFGHVLWAIVRGGKLRHFLWPSPRRLVQWILDPKPMPSVGGGVKNFLSSLRLGFYFWLGLRAFAGGLVWLAVPVGLLVWAAQLPAGRGGGILSFLGGFALLCVAIYLPFLQTRFALENRFGSLFEVGAVRHWFRRAPIAFWLALGVTLVFALPLYLLKIELPPREIAWLPSLIFVVFMLPARLLTGWAVGRARRRELPRHGIFRWTGRLGLVPLGLLYAVFVYLTQYLTWNGSWSLLEQHAFLVPAPLMSL